MKKGIILCFIILILVNFAQLYFSKKQHNIQKLLEESLIEHEKYVYLSSSIIHSKMTNELMLLTKQYLNNESGDHMYIVFIPENVCKSCLSLLYSELKNRRLNINSLVFISPEINGQDRHRMKNENISLGFKNFITYDKSYLNIESNGLITIFKLNSSHKIVRYLYYDTPFRLVYYNFFE